MTCRHCKGEGGHVRTTRYIPRHALVWEDCEPCQGTGIGPTDEDVRSTLGLIDAYLGEWYDPDGCAHEDADDLVQTIRNEIKRIGW